MADCEHKSCGSTEKVWLPYYYDGRIRGLKPHPYCMDCGLIKNLSSDRPRAIGYYMNTLSELSKLYKSAQVQMRLISQEFERQRLNDPYGMDRQQQEKLFIDIVKRYVNIPERALIELIQI
ncbi:MAG: hypothetical protein WB392_03875 [Methanotrichaceae archaeon]